MAYGSRISSNGSFDWLVPCYLPHETRSIEKLNDEIVFAVCDSDKRFCGLSRLIPVAAGAAAGKAVFDTKWKSCHGAGAGNPAIAWMHGRW
jgi:hypothetical protein